MSIKTEDAYVALSTIGITMILALKQKGRRSFEQCIVDTARVLNLMNDDEIENLKRLVAEKGLALAKKLEEEDKDKQFIIFPNLN